MALYIRKIKEKSSIKLVKTFTRETLKSTLESCQKQMMKHKIQENQEKLTSKNSFSLEAPSTRQKINNYQEVFYIYDIKKEFYFYF